MMTKAKPMTPKSQASTPKGNLKGVKNTPIGKNKTPKFKATPTGKVSLINNGTPKSAGKQNAGNNTPKGKNSPAFTPKNKQGNGKAFTPGNKQTPQGKKNTPKGQKTPKSPWQKSPLTEEQLKLKAAQIIGNVENDDESDDSDEDINEGVQINEEVSDEEVDSDAEDESDDEGVTGILGNSLADDSDDDDEDFDDDDDDEDEETENKGIKKFKGLKPSLAGEDDDKEDEDSSDDDDDSPNNSGPGLKALLGQSLAEDDDDEDFTDNDEEEDDDDDISDEEEDEELGSSPVKKQKQAAEDDDDDDEDEEEEDDDSEEAEDDAETSKLSVLEDDDDEDHEENESDEDLDASKEDSVEQDNLLTPEERAERDKRSIYVGNLPKDIQKVKLQSLFKQFGPIETVRIRGAVGKDAKTSKKVAVIKREEMHPDVPCLHAFVRFIKEASAKKALAFNGHKLGDHYLRVDLVSGDGAKPDTKKAVFLGNLSFKLDDNSIWAHFADCGKIASVRIVRDKKTGMGKGFGYVNFETTDAVALALKLNGTTLMEREIRVQLCSDSPQKKQKNVGQKRPQPNFNKGNSPKKFKDGSGDAVSVATHNSQNAERRKDRRSQGEQQRQTGNGKPGFKQGGGGGGGFQGQKADNKKKQKFNKFDKQKKQVAAKFTAKPRKPSAD